MDLKPWSGLAYKFVIFRFFFGWDGIEIMCPQTVYGR